MSFNSFAWLDVYYWEHTDLTIYSGAALYWSEEQTLTVSEWLTHQHRDTLASIVGHPPLLAYISIADGECLARERFEVIEVSSYDIYDLWDIADVYSGCCSLVGNHLERRTSRSIRGIVASNSKLHGDHVVLPDVMTLYQQYRLLASLAVPKRPLLFRDCSSLECSTV